MAENSSFFAENLSLNVKTAIFVTFVLLGAAVTFGMYVARFNQLNDRMTLLEAAQSSQGDDIGSLKSDSRVLQTSLNSLDVTLQEIKKQTGRPRGLSSDNGDVQN